MLCLTAEAKPQQKPHEGDQIINKNKGGIKGPSVLACALKEPSETPRKRNHSPSHELKLKGV